MQQQDNKAGIILFGTALIIGSLTGTMIAYGQWVIGVLLH